MAAEKVRVRYAPSPTGEPHIGNIRTALFNWLFARHAGGDFIVRIEDTDQERLVPGAVDSILDGLEWLGIDWDEGPRVGGQYGSYFQSERLPRYEQAAERLIAEGVAYRCYCSRERLDQVRKQRQQEKLDRAYDRHCRDLTPEQRHDMEAEGGPCVVRYAMPTAGTTSVQDLIRGRSRVAESSAGRFHHPQVGRISHLPSGRGGGRPLDGDEPRPAGRGVALQHPPARQPLSQSGV